jgi:DNA polymerase I-like protein with 3'-5' exonuclease and polymerase domains
MNVLEKSGGKIVISDEDSKRFLDVKHSLFPEIKGSYHKYVERCAKDNRILYNLHGHPYQITDHDIDDSMLKELYAWIPQSTVGEITNIAYSDMYHYISRENKKWSLLANTHDSYMIQCPEDEATECGTKAAEFMQQEFLSPIDGAKFQMKSEVQVGYNWSPAKESNPLGLRTIKI